jgi:hypothetical protein
MMNYLKWYAFQFFENPCIDVFELLQQFNQLKIDIGSISTLVLTCCMFSLEPRLILLSFLIL